MDINSKSELLAPADEQLERLRAASPAWKIWFVPTLQAGGGTLIKWCAQPKPLLNCDSPEELAAEMRAADHWRSGNQPGGAGEFDLG